MAYKSDRESFISCTNSLPRVGDHVKSTLIDTHSWVLRTNDHFYCTSTPVFTLVTLTAEANFFLNILLYLILVFFVCN